MGLITGTQNVIKNWDNIDGSFVKFNQYFAVGVVAGSTGAALAESGVGAPGVGMASGWLLNSGNSYIQGTRGGDVVEAGGQGALWGGVSGFAMMGLEAGINGLMNIPINVKTGSGLIEPYTLKPQTAQTTLGEWLFGYRSSNISNIIANQGTSNASVILAAYNPLETAVDLLDYRDYNVNGFEGAYLKLGVRGNYYQYNWVQTIASSDYSSPKIDGMNDNGFFRSQQFVHQYDGYNWGFEDGPGRGIDVNWRAELTLVGNYKGAAWRPIMTFSWGFDRVGNLTTKSPLTIIKNPSTFHIGVVNRACRAHSFLKLIL